MCGACGLIQPFNLPEGNLPPPPPMPPADPVRNRGYWSLSSGLAGLLLVLSIPTLMPGLRTLTLGWAGISLTVLGSGSLAAVVLGATDPHKDPLSIVGMVLGCVGLMLWLVFV